MSSSVCIGVIDEIMKSPPHDQGVVMEQPDPAIAGRADVAPEVLTEVAVVQDPLISVVQADRTLPRGRAGMLRSQSPSDV
jgi:hypothetical protein